MKCLAGEGRGEQDEGHHGWTLVTEGTELLELGSYVQLGRGDTTLLTFLGLSGFPVEHGRGVGCAVADWRSCGILVTKAQPSAPLTNCGEEMAVVVAQHSGLWTFLLLLGKKFVFEGGAAVPQEQRRSQGGPQCGHSPAVLGHL